MSSNSIDIKEIRKFGLIAFIFFGSLGTLGLWGHKPIPTCIFGCLSLLGLCFFLIPAPLKPAFVHWLKLAHLIGRMINILILGTTYYVVITPFAFVKRLFGGKPLPTQPDKTASSYWVTRTEPVQPKERFVKRY